MNLLVVGYLQTWQENTRICDPGIPKRATRSFVAFLCVFEEDS